MEIFVLFHCFGTKPTISLRFACIEDENRNGFCTIREIVQNCISRLASTFTQGIKLMFYTWIDSNSAL